jgi:polyferredoxin
MLAGAVVVIHFLIVLFVVAGVPVIYVGAARGWAWVRSRLWRLVHLCAIFIIAAESVLGIACPLTIWEDRLRGREIATRFIERWIDRVLFYEAPGWVFTLAYVAFAALVLVTWVAVPPAKDARDP